MKTYLIVIAFLVIVIFSLLGVITLVSKEADYRNCVAYSEQLGVPYTWDWRWECQMKINDGWWYTTNGLAPGPGPIK